MDAFKTFTFADGRTLELYHDETPDASPREWDNLGTMACFHTRYDLGDDQDGIRGHGIDHKEFCGWDEMEKWICHENPDCVILPLYLFDHSGLSMRTTTTEFRTCDGQGWDWGQVGFIFVTRKKINEEYGASGGRTDEQIEEYLRNEVTVYDQYLTGDVYGYIMREPSCEKCDGPGEEGDSCWGFYGADPLENGMSDHLDEKHREELKALV